MAIFTESYIDVSKLLFWGEVSGDVDPSRKPRMVISFRDGNPRITVYTGEQGPGGVISFPSDYPTMVSILSLLKDIINSEPGTKVSVDSLTTIYENNKPTNDKKVVSTLYIGKSKQGIIYFSLIAENKPKIVFPFKASPFHVYRDNEGNIIPDEIISKKITENLVNFILNIISNAIVKYTEEEYTFKRKPIKTKNSTNIITELDNIEFNSNKTNSVVETSIDSIDI